MVSAKMLCYIQGHAMGVAWTDGPGTEVISNDHLATVDVVVRRVPEETMQKYTCIYSVRSCPRSCARKG